MPPVWPATGGTALPGAALALQTVADLKRQCRQLLKARSSSRTLQQLQHLAQLKHPPSTASVAEPAAMLQNAIILEQLINSWSHAGGRGQVLCCEQQQDAGYSDVAAADRQAVQQEQQQQLHSTIAALQQEVAAMAAKHRAAQARRAMCHGATPHRIAVLCCAVLCCAVLCCAVLCCAVRCCAVLQAMATDCAWGSE
jgi:hypothetical protein